MKKIVMAVPKGRIFQELEPLLKKAKIEIEEDFYSNSSRKLFFKTNIENFEIIRVRSFDVATFVKFGAADIGICGYDVLKEFSSSEVFSILDLEIGKCRLSIASKKDVKIDLKNRTHIKIASKYPKIVGEFFEAQGIQAEIIKLNGAIEIASKVGLCDLIVDLVSSGKTLKENDMIEVKNILNVTSRLIVNRNSFKTSNSEINKIINLFNAP
jgi:ATP phosphoribosyltransferase